jgi:DNA-3-methyladenine glycosylase
MKVEEKLRTPLPRQFYARDPRIVSRDLLGKVLVRREGKKLLAGRIVEVEAYLGLNDPAAHSAAGRTLRNAVLFGPPGHSYVYFIYGNHYCFNVSCLPDEEAGGVLFRALEPLLGIKEMTRARGITRMRDNAKDLTRADSDLFITADSYPPPRVRTTVRIGITKAAKRPLRFLIAGNEFISRA